MIPNFICKIDEVLYGLEQAHHAWYSRLSSKLQCLGFKASKADMSLFYFNKAGATVFVLVYVEDIIVGSSTCEAYGDLLRNLKKDFGLKDLDELHYFLGIDVNRVNGGSLLTQDKYASDLLKQVNMFNCKPISTPLSTSVVGALQYLTLTRLDISL